MTRGGANLIIQSWVSLHKIPFSLSFVVYILALPADSFNTTPIRSPLPLTRSTLSEFMATSCSRKYLPSSKDFAARFSSRRTSIDAIATTHPRGFPPNVDPWLPGLKTPNMSLFAATALTGKTPPPRALPIIMISGSMLSYMNANIFPVLANPVWISSTARRILFSLEISLNPFRYPSAGTTTPASP